MFSRSVVRWRGAAALLLAVLPLIASAAEDKTFSVAALRADLELLRTALHQAHPGLTRYASERELRRAFANAEQALDSPGTEIDLFRAIAPVLATIRDDHTFALPSAAYWRERFGPMSFSQKNGAGDLALFPLFITVQGGRLYVTHDNSAEPAIARGTEILRIDGRPVRDVLRRLERALPTSGFSRTRPARSLEQFDLHQEYNLWCVYYALMIGTPERFVLQVRATPDARTATVTAPALRAAAIWENFRARASTSDALLARDRPMRLTYPAADTALLSLSSFHTWRWRRDKLDFRRDIAAVFRELADRGMAKLIVDLRGNEGGDAGIAIEVLGFLARRPFQVYDYKEVMSNHFPALRAHVRNPDGLANLADELFEPAAGGRLRIKTDLPEETWSRPMDPAAPQFAGQLWILADGATGSAAAQLATLVRVNRPDAVFVGEESGGDMEGPISGSYLELVLQNTGIRVDIPILKKVMHLGGYRHGRGRGVPADHPITPSQADIAQGRDAALAFTLRETAGAR